MSDRHLNIYLAEHPEYILLEDADEEDKAVLIKAAEKKYISFKIAPTGDKCFEPDDLTKAYMWKEKGCLDD